jgi:hypothetical protein
MKEIMELLFYVTIASFFLLYFNNKSNISSEYIIPLIVALQVKYYIGGSNENNKNNKNNKNNENNDVDFYYWGKILVLSYLIVLIFKKD